MTPVDLPVTPALSLLLMNACGNARYYNCLSLQKREIICKFMYFIINSKLHTALLTKGLGYLGSKYLS